MSVFLVRVPHHSSLSAIFLLTNLSNQPMVFFPQDLKDEERKSRQKILSRSPSALFFPPVLVHARISYQSTRHFFSRKRHSDMDLKLRIDSAGHISYETGIFFTFLLFSHLQPFFYYSSAHITLYRSLTSILHLFGRNKTPNKKGLQDKAHY